MIATLGTVAGVFGGIAREGPSSPFFNDLVGLDSRLLWSLAEAFGLLFLTAFVMLHIRAFAQAIPPFDSDDPGCGPHLDSPEPRK